MLLPSIKLNLLQFQSFYKTKIMKSLLATILLLFLVSCQQPSLPSHVIPLFGNATLGYYYANIFIGTPPQKQSVIMDTGSGQLAIPCSECKSCGRNHLNKYFNLKQSQSSKILTCSSKESVCINTCRNKGQSDPCSFSISYAEGSSLNGIIIEDTIQFQSNSSGQSISTFFGCTIKQTNLFFTQQANGIFGLAPRRQFQLLDRMYKKHNPFTGEKLLFSMCLDRNGGQMSFGKPKINQALEQNSVTVSFNSAQNLYSLEEVGSLQAGDIVIHKKGDHMGSFGVFIDSGSTFTYLPRGSFKNFQVALQNACSEKPQKCLMAKNNPSCYKITTNSTIKQSLDQIFPSLDIEIADRIISWIPSKYFLLQNLSSGQVCLAVDPLDRFILGANWMVDRQIIFDIEGKKVTIISDVSCKNFPPEKNIPTIVEQIPVYKGGSKIQKQVSYIQAVFQIDNNFTIFIIILVLILCFLLTLLIVIGKIFSPKKSKVQVRKKEGEESKIISQSQENSIVSIQHQGQKNVIFSQQSQ